MTTTENCIWSAKFHDRSHAETLYTVSCRPINFVTKFNPSDITFCPFCGNKVEENKANADT